MKIDKTYDQIAQARDALERAVGAYLQSHGWERTCTTPGSWWLWQNTLPDGRIVLVGRDEAVRIQEAMSCDERGGEG